MSIATDRYISIEVLRARHLSFEKKIKELEEEKLKQAEISKFHKSHLRRWNAHYDEEIDRCKVAINTLLGLVDPNTQNSLKQLIKKAEKERITCKKCGGKLIFREYAGVLSGVKPTVAICPKCDAINLATEKRKTASMMIGFISTKEEMPKPSKKNRYFSEPVMILVGKRKYKAEYNFQRKHFFRIRIQGRRSYIFPDKNVLGWRYLSQDEIRAVQY